MESVNLQEIIVMNSSGIFVLLMLILSRFENKEMRHLGNSLFDAMIGITLGALVMETLSFLVNGKPGTLIRGLSYLINGYLFLASSAVGLLWVLFVDYQIYHSTKRLRKNVIPLAIPAFLIVVLVIGDMMGADNIFSITEQNLYVRGKWVLLSFAALFFYYVYSIAEANIAVYQRGHIHLFPVHYFIFPCIVGTIVQGLFYGISVGWFGVSMAFFMIQAQLQRMNSYMDDLSGLYNRKYYRFYIEKIANSKKNRTIYGIMMDVNQFKKINDTFGHTTGDDAIRSIGKILSEVTTEQHMVIRLSGDEFAIITVDTQEAEIQELITLLLQRVEWFNRSAGKPYQLSLAVGYSSCETAYLNSNDFLHQMDARMYEAKSRFYEENSGIR